VCAALRHDELLRELLQTPLLLSIAALAYQGRPALAVQASGTLEQQRAQLFAVYIKAMFKRRGKTADYTQEQSRHWLGWLAATLL
jgi:hypothetical protein